jgi:hypothetical protein
VTINGESSRTRVVKIPIYGYCRNEMLSIFLNAISRLILLKIKNNKKAPTEAGAKKIFGFCSLIVNCISETQN